ncbi:MAG: hypothetical protein EZS28_022794, partial [Streblomastix strix]
MQWFERPPPDKFGKQQLLRTEIQVWMSLFWLICNDENFMKYQYDKAKGLQVRKRNSLKNPRKVIFVLNAKKMPKKDAPDAKEFITARLNARRDIGWFINQIVFRCSWKTWKEIRNNNRHQIWF